MAGLEASYREYQDDDDEDSESFVISSDSENEKNRIIISDDEEDDNIVIPESSDDEATSTSEQHNRTNGGRITPLVRKAIRRSLHHFKDSTDDEMENISSENVTDSSVPHGQDVSDSDEPIVYVKKNHKRSNQLEVSGLDDSIVKVQSKPKRIHRLVDSSDEDEPHTNHDTSSDEHGAAIASDSMRSVHLDSSNESGSVSSENSVEDELAMSIAIEESKNSSLDPKLAQKKAYLETQQQQLEKQLTKSKMLFNSGQLAVLPDRGEKIRQSIISQETELKRIRSELRALQFNESSAEMPAVAEVKKKLFEEGSLEINPTFLKPTTSTHEKDLGKKALETFQREQDLTVERLKDLHGSLLGRPAEDQLAEDPRGLKIKLMPHQKYALTWLLWREQQNPPGGVLADDMGLGKTMTMISLIVAANQIKDAGDSSDEEEQKWLSSARTQRHLGGTLVVAPASLVAQWQGEIQNRCKSGLLTTELFHGNNRELNPKRLARNDVVITTYNILTRAFKTSGVLYKIHWKRVILDEAHVIRNHKSQTCEAVCGLSAIKRWVLTGTPVHNKEMDLFSLLKFLKCSPFDDVRVWKRWVDNKNVAGSERLATVMKSIMLRRTKQELQANGSVDTIPDKSIEIIEVKLDPDERLVYDKVMVYSRTLFAQFLAQRAEKAHMHELGAGLYDKPSWQTTYRDTQFTKAQKKLLSTHADVAAHQILVLLLRLRQLCCHPSLIHAMLDQEDMEINGLGEVADPSQLLTRLNDMSIQEDDAEDAGEIGVDERVLEHLLTSENPVFDPNRQSSKMKAIVEKIQEIVENSDDKLIVVSQWTSVLEIVAKEIKNMKNVSYRMFTGKVAVKDRQSIMDDFNSRHSRTNVLLLSLTAGGVGLNLVGANHLILMDIHWNPQLESQAQDRIHRFGQKKTVWIYKYICTDTIEERIKGLQDKKLEIADSLLSGSGKAGASKLSLDEMKTLFGV